MRFTRGIFFGFVIGTVIGLLIYLRLQRENGERVQEIHSLRIHLPDTPDETSPLTIPRAESQTPSTAPPLEAIVGIGKVRADRLRAAGIETLAALAAASAKRVQEILGPRVSLDTAAAFIAEAGDLRE